LKAEVGRVPSPSETQKKKLPKKKSTKRSTASLKQRDDVFDERLGNKGDALGVPLGVNMKPETGFMFINKGQVPIKKDRLHGYIRDRLVRCHL
jgi:hypothetical protein